MTLKFASSLLSLVVASAMVQAEQDPYLWLEEVHGERAMEWVEQQNEMAQQELAQSELYQLMYDQTLEVLDSDDRIDFPSRQGEYLYNFWRDANNQRGLYRRTTVESYASGKPEWQVVLDIDALAAAEDENWVYKGMSCLYPDYQRCLVNLSRGGADATVVREFDKNSMSFVEDGFTLPEAKSRVGWINQDSLYVATDFGKDSLTTSGYPREVRVWHRGADLAKAPALFNGDVDSVAAGAYRIFTATANYDVVYESPNFYSNKMWLRHNDELLAIPKPDSATLRTIFNDQLILMLREDWSEHGFKQGSLVAMPMSSVHSGKAEASLVMAPTETMSIQGVTRTKDHLLITVLQDVTSRVFKLEASEQGWQVQDLELADNASISVFNTDETDNVFHYTVNGFLTPTTLMQNDTATQKASQLRQAPSWFDEARFDVQQYKAKSADGTQVPYFVVKAKDVELNGKNPTLLYGYGGFEVSMRPSYSAVLGRNWLEQGGVYVLGNIRGGGEYGPAWHQAALQKNRMRAYEDFFAIAEDLIERKITAPQHLGIKGGSNGGLLTGAAMVLRPELFNAVISQVPLLDMKRYHLLLAGASWMAEYGNPDDPEMWEVIKTYSPYHNLHKDRTYPRAFFYTSTRDDRVHPAHARKMVARMLEQEHPVVYFENIEGGHAGASDNRQSARMAALEYSYLWQQLK